MVDFSKLKSQNKKTAITNPIEIFRRLPKAPGINDLYASQAEVLENWFAQKDQKDSVIKLHTGGGKTLVGLLIAQSCLVDLKEPVLYLVPTLQLVAQTLEKSESYGIRAVPYEAGSGIPLNEEFLNGDAILIATYKALFNGRSKFKLRGAPQPQNVGAIVLDDAHTAFSVIRETFTIQISSNDNQELYNEISSMFRQSFGDVNKLGLFDDILDGSESNVLEVPYWAWKAQGDAVRTALRSSAASDSFAWPLLRDNLRLCHAFISRNAFSITPILPMLNLFPTFYDAPRRIYMSATIADDSELIKTFDISDRFVSKPLSSSSLAGVSERMVLIPDSMPCGYDINGDTRALVEWAAKNKKGAVILVPSGSMAESWGNCASYPKKQDQIEQAITSLQNLNSFGPIVFANRYDGIDLPGDSCRLLVLHGLPTGISDYEQFRATALYGGTSITRMIAQRLEQGMGRGARGAGDHCAIILAGGDLSSWVSQKKNFRFLTDATRAQLEIGMNVSREIESLKDLAGTIKKCFTRDQDWTTYHAETLDELIEMDDERPPHTFAIPMAERAAFNLWENGQHEKAIGKIETLLQGDELKGDRQTKGWMEQFIARIANDWGSAELTEKHQVSAFANNRNLLRPRIMPPYTPIALPESQAHAIAKQIQRYQFRSGLVSSFNDCVALLTKDSSANQFEQALLYLAKFIGLSGDRYDVNGEGPDVLWLLPHKVGFVIEAKSRKKDKNALTKGEHGQLLVASEWFTKNYSGYDCVRVSVHPENKATKAAVAHASHALTYKKLAQLISDSRVLLSDLCNSRRSGEQLVYQCAQALSSSPIEANKLKDNYLIPFEVQD